MSQTGYTPIQLYYSTTASNTPSVANLSLGELGINLADQKAYMLNSAGTAVVTLVGTLGNQNANSVSITGGSVNGTTIGATTASTGAFTTISATGVITSTVATGTAPFTIASTTQVANLNAATAGTATNATNTAITDNTTSSATWYPTIVSATTGNLPQTTSSTKLSFVPSTGILTSTGFSGAHNGTVGATTPSTGAFTTLSASTSFQNSTWITSGRPTGVTGLQGYNTTLKGVEVYNGSAWDSLTGPVFSAYPSANQTVTSATFTNVTSDTKNFDTNGCFNNTGSSTTLNGLTAPAYAFVPNVAGYYQVTGLLAFVGNISGSTLITIYKNGTRFQDGMFGNAGGIYYYYVNYLIYLNGTGDYIQLYGYVSSITPTWYGGANASYFQATFVRGA